MTGRRLISSGSEFETRAGYSRAVVDGDDVFVSGTTGFDYRTMRISEDPVEQTRQCLRNIEEGFVPELYDPSVLTSRFSVSTMLTSSPSLTRASSRLSGTP